jgi:hypothetical protein
MTGLVFNEVEEGGEKKYIWDRYYRLQVKIGVY